MQQTPRCRTGSLLALVLGFGLGLIPVAIIQPAAAQGGDEAWVPFTILYSSDVKGHIEPCG